MITDIFGPADCVSFTPLQCFVCLFVCGPVSNLRNTSLIWLRLCCIFMKFQFQNLGTNWNLIRSLSFSHIIKNQFWKRWVSSVTLILHFNGQGGKKFNDCVKRDVCGAMQEESMGSLVRGGFRLFSFCRESPALYVCVLIKEVAAKKLPSWNPLCWTQAGNHGHHLQWAVRFQIERKRYERLCVFVYEEEDVVIFWRESLSFSPSGCNKIYIESRRMSTKYYMLVNTNKTRKCHPA